MGIDLDLFVSAVDDDFICLICNLVLDNPIRILKCEHMFCRECINEWMKQMASCPVDRHQITDSDLIAPNRTVISMLNKLKLKCKFNSLGCQLVVQLDAWKNHLKQCELNPNKQQPCVGCQKMLSNDDVESHKCFEKLEFEIMKLKQENNELKYLVNDYQSANEKLEREVKKLKQELFDVQNNNLLVNLVDRNEENQETIKRLENQKAILIAEIQILKNQPTPSTSSKTTELFIHQSENNFSQNYLKNHDLGMTTSIDKWLILSRLPEDLKSQIRLASVLGTGDMFEAIFITKDDEAFWVNSDKETVRIMNTEKTKIGALSKQKIETLVFGGGFDSRSCVWALTSDKKVLGWSNNNHHLVKATNRTSTVIGLNDKKIVQVACGDRHALALTSDGEVYSWGENDFGQLGTGTTYDQLHPVRVTKGIGSRRTVAVACCFASSFAVTDNGEVYSWGSNKWGTLGVGNEAIEFIVVATKIRALEGVKIRRLACGLLHVLAVAEDGSMYAWGLNENGQLGAGDIENRSKPVKVGPDGVNFIEVAASISYNSLSVALSEENRCWVWGWCRTGTEFEFKRVLFSFPVESASIHDAIAEYADFQMTWKTMVFS